MVAEEVSSLIVTIGQIGLWIQALGIVVILWIVFQIISYIYNRRRMREIYTIKEDMKRMENKLDRLIKKKK